MIVILFLLLLDFQATRTADIPNGDFRITEIEEPALTGCAITPSNGTRNNVILIQPPYHLPNDEPFQWDAPQQDGFSNNIIDQYESSKRVVQRMPFPPVSPPDPSELPNPPQPPVATPEPPTIALLTLTGLVLLFLLFGRQMRRHR